MAIMDNAGKTTSVTEGLDLTGRTLDDFHVLRRLGQGGMGAVYLAEQVSLKRKVALKILRTELAVNPEALERFKKEAENVARATHANIVQVYAIGTADGLPYMALEYVEGRNLREYLAKKGPPELSVALRIMSQVAAALQRAAELGIVHRDIKPDNILLTRKGEVKVADFGLSRVLNGAQPALHLTATGVTMGTPLYMSPEQVEGKPVDSRTDIYSFGVTCYHMLAGHPPFRGQNAFEVALQHVNAEPRPLAEARPDLPPSLCTVVHKMMAKGPDRRYQTGRELLKDLAGLRLTMSGPSNGTAPVTSVDPAAPATPATGTVRTVPVQPLSRPRWVSALAGLAIGLGLAAGVALGWYGSRPTPLPQTPATGTPADFNDVDTVLHAPQRREQALREAAEQYLDPATATKNIATGYGLCCDLAVFYLENHRLDDADRLFGRLETFKNPQYHSLGLLGQAIILALRDKAPESNALFTQLAKELNGPRQIPLKRLDEPRNAPLRYWITRAQYYNAQNGIAESEVPSFFKPLRELATRHGGTK
jgi:serine/threonine-protein kinase